ncbi:SNF2-related protein [Streptomyces scabiei]|uniref:DEAD/DEAH box helicase n=1 Tax=Streptomyces scabiei TaxID=1930 RepID=UPI000A634ADF|nr:MULTISPECIES: DEAD/DEAH box helicase [Streptomyces]MDX2551705.1 DEAD/DEAH box helicase [Streptomyces stelliscabiei]MDX2636088.1 DEAD/DEAH box helicase [Streptomyces stelliscabiei]MDX2802814.1 DEAD/DEAH box helicase [Streptomyces scabiei]MDX3026295.1 DEAD/DEAH box helicase [Streptomyces scabiei]MDX3196389.1 DEAD/DEAH box helicase [Streptomyces scabiei]
MSVETGATGGQGDAVWDAWEPDEPPVGGQGRLSAGYAPGAQVLIRDELWLVRKVTNTRHDGWMVEVTGVSSFVRGTDAVFYDRLDDIQVLDPRETQLVADDSSNHRRARLFLEAVMRKTYLPQTEHGLALCDGFLMDQQVHQLRPAELALSMKNPQPRILIADVVGLGKTLEIGVLLAELIRRGRGERILVVTPQHVLEQFQRELWTRFAIPLVRLDSTGIQRVQQEIPAGRNPFAYFKRAIISVDTLKSDVYAHHLEHTDWDAVVIDESHNLVNRGTKNNALARLLAQKTDALILASATPHNGDAASFAELIKMLDEAAIADPSNYEVKDLEHLYIRRTKTTDEVREGLKGAWADRGPSQPLHVPAGEKELAVFKELASRWIPADPSVPSASTYPLVPYQLLKSFLSSHRALLETIKTRLTNLDKPLAEKPTTNAKRKTRPVDPAVREAARKAERAALVELQALAEQIQDDDSAKLAALLKELRALGVGPGSDTRVVVFSERIPTLKWLAETVPAALDFPRGTAADPSKPWLDFGGAVQVMHGNATTDEEQTDIVEKFGLRDDPVRILFTGDVASEGVNLHQQCHLLIHYDLPWSLIRIEQRNGRIDRYGQEHQPQFRALILTSDVPWRTDEATGQSRTLDDRLVGEKLLKREEQAHKIEGSAEAVTGLYRAQEEENRLTQDLIAGRTVEDSIKQSQLGGAAFLTGLLGQVGAVPEHPEVPRAAVPNLFRSTADYFNEALRQVCHPNPEDQLSLLRYNDGTIAFEPPGDLLYRLKSLPKSYLDEQRILPRKNEKGRMRITFSKTLASARLKAARDSSKSQWPNVSYVSDVHPVLDWLTDKVLVQVGRHQAPVLAAAVDHPVFLVQGIYSNAMGRPTVVEWMAVTGLPDDPEIKPLTAQLLEDYGVGPNMPGRATPRDLPGLAELVPAAIDEAERFLKSREEDYKLQIDKTLAPYRKRVTHWKQEALFAGTRRDKQEVDLAASRRLSLVKSLETAGKPMLRLLAVLEPHAATAGDTAR